MIDLKEAREKSGMTQQELADKVLISRTAIANIECGFNSPSVETAQRIGEVLGFDWTEFFKPEKNFDSLVS